MGGNEMDPIDEQTKRKQKEHLYQLFAEVTSALANPHRLELLDLLTQAPRTVDELATESHMSVANTSQHLQRLKRARLVVSSPEGLSRRYRLADPAVGRLWLELRAVAERQLAEVRQALDAYRDRRHKLQGVTAEELHTQLEEDDVLLLDTRPAVEYKAGHLPVAISAPLDELPQKLDEIPQNKTVIAYCRGPYCDFADDALALLDAHGYKTLRLEEGVAEWQVAGFPISQEERRAEA